MYKMFGSDSKFSKSNRKMNRNEILEGLSYYTEINVIKNKTNSTVLFDSLPKPIEKSKLEEALKSFEATPKE